MPQFYLRRFANSAEQLAQIEKDSGRSYVCSVRDAAAIRDFHRLDMGSGDPGQAEKDLAKVEARFAEGLGLVVDQGASSPVLRSRLAQFVNMMRFRVPAFKEFFEQQQKQFLADMGRFLMAKGKLPPPPDELGDDPFSSIDFKIANTFLLFWMFRFAAEVEVIELLEAMTPTIYESPGELEFLTCDQPVAIYSPLARPDDALGVGLGDALVQVTFPLTRKSLLCLSWNTESAERIEANQEQVDEFNRRTIIMGDQYIFSHTDESLTELIEKWRKCRAGLSFEVQGKPGARRRYLLHQRPVLAPEQYS